MQLNIRKREQARKERYKAQKEAERLKEEEERRVEEELAKDKWDEKIKKILSQREREESFEIDLFEGFSNKAWYEDFFGFNLNDFCLDDGTPVDGKQYVFLRPRHWPIHEMKVEANQGELVKATFYVCDLERPFKRNSQTMVLLAPLSRQPKNVLRFSFIFLCILFATTNFLLTMMNNTVVRRKPIQVRRNLMI